MEALNIIQKKLKAPKGQHNNFGNYDYRSCEDILEAVKPLLGEAILTLTDDVVLIGDRFYVKAFATIKHKEESVTVTALARESSEKKGMDTAQITGAASSYARKYALNGLFLIDDTKDADTKNNNPETPMGFISLEQAKDINTRITNLGKSFLVDKFFSCLKATETTTILARDYDKAIKILEQAETAKIKEGKK